MAEFRESPPGYKSGGIASLRGFINEHKEAVEYDLITSASVELSDVGGSLTWGAFASLIKNLPHSSATWKELHPDMAEWTSPLKTNLLLADIYDVLSQINANVCSGISRSKPHPIKPYPRPWVKNDKHYGESKDAMPAQDLEEWIANKWEEARRKHEHVRSRKSVGDNSSVNGGLPSDNN